METTRHFPLGLRRRANIQQIRDESRQFWSRRRIRMALMIVCAVLLLEWGVSTAFHVGSAEKWGRGPELYHQISGYFGLRPQWARALLVTKEGQRYT